MTWRGASSLSEVENAHLEKPFQLRCRQRSDMFSKPVLRSHQSRRGASNAKKLAEQRLVPLSSHHHEVASYHSQGAGEVIDGERSFEHETKIDPNAKHHHCPCQNNDGNDDGRGFTAEPRRLYFIVHVGSNARR